MGECRYAQLGVVGSNSDRFNNQGHLKIGERDDRVIGGVGTLARWPCIFHPSFIR